MTGTRSRSVNQALARLRQQVAKLGSEVVTTRRSLGWSQARVARRAGVAQASVARFEAGNTHLTLPVMVAIMAAVGLDVSLRAFPGGGVSLRDSGQLALADGLCAEANQAWKAHLEAPTGPGSMQAADILFQGARAGIHVELESNFVDLQAQLRNGTLKRDALQQRLGFPVAFVLGLRDSPTNRAAVAAHRSVVLAALPAGSREVFAAIRNGTPLARDGLVWLRPHKRRQS
jgi:transcriptional regulator with XRE-family HTH domain